MAGRDYNKLLPGFLTSLTPPPRTHNKGGGAMLGCFREKEELL